MAHYRLVSFKACPWVQRAAIVLREKQAPFEFVHITSEDRPDWFAEISPHGKVPVLQIDGDLALFESNAIAEYLDDSIGPRLHPEDPVQRAVNRAWTDYLPTFSAALGAVGSAANQAEVDAARTGLAKPFDRLEAALTRNGAGPFFNGPSFSLVDAAYAPFLQRFLIIEQLVGEPLIAATYPRLRQWSEALVARPSTHSFPPEEFRTLYLGALQKRGSFVARQALEA